MTEAMTTHDVAFSKQNFPVFVESDKNLKKIALIPRWDH